MRQIVLHADIATFQAVAVHYLSKPEPRAKRFYWEMMAKERMSFIWQTLLESPQVIEETKEKIRALQC